MSSARFEGRGADLKFQRQRQRKKKGKKNKKEKKREKNKTEKKKKEEKKEAKKAKEGKKKECTEQTNSLQDFLEKIFTKKNAARAGKKSARKRNAMKKQTRWKI